MHADNQERKEPQVFQEFPVELELWEREDQVDLKDHPDHQEQMPWIMVAPEEMENQVFPDLQERSDTQE